MSALTGARLASLGGFTIGMMVLFSPMEAQAESLRCNGGTVAEGDSRMSVLYKCGEPVLRDSRCAEVIGAGGVWPVTPYGTAVPCLPIDEWLYDRGEGNMMVTIRFRAGLVQSFTYGRSPR